MAQPPRTLRDFLEEFVDNHTVVGSDEVLLDVTPEDAEDLGMFFVRGICGWMHGLRRVREGQPSTDLHDELAEEDVEEISDVETEFVQ